MARFKRPKLGDFVTVFFLDHYSHDTGKWLSQSDLDEKVNGYCVAFGVVVGKDKDFLKVAGQATLDSDRDDRSFGGAMAIAWWGITGIHHHGLNLKGVSEFVNG